MHRIIDFIFILGKLLFPFTLSKDIIGNFLNTRISSMLFQYCLKKHAHVDGLPLITNFIRKDYLKGAQCVKMLL